MQIILSENTTMKLTTLLFLSLLFSLLVGCTGGNKLIHPVYPGPLTRTPILLIAGGGAISDGPVYPAFLSQIRSMPNEPGSVLILPTASGVPEESGLGTARAFQKIATQHTIDLLLLTQDNPQRADDPDAANQLREADGIWFTGGDQSRITHVFRPETDSDADAQSASLADAALRDMLARGGVIGSTSAGAAMMSHPMIAGGQSDDALLLGTQEGGVILADGMRLFTFGIIDQHFLKRGRMGRLIAALENSDADYGFGIEEGAAVIVVFGDDDKMIGLGPDCALIIDTTQEQIAGNGERTNIRFTLLGEDDVWDLRLHRATPHFAKQDRAQITLPIDGPTPDPNRGAWEEGAIRDAIHALAANPESPQTLQSEHFTLTFSADETTVFYMRHNDRRDLCASNIRLDITPRE